MQTDQSFPFPSVRRREEPTTQGAPILCPPTEQQGQMTRTGFTPMSEQERERDMTPNVVVRSSRATRQAQPSHHRAESNSSNEYLPHQPQSWPGPVMSKDGALPRQNTYPPLSPLTPVSPGIISSVENSYGGAQSAFHQVNTPPQQQAAVPTAPITHMMQMPPMPQHPGAGPVMNPQMPSSPPHAVQQQLRSAPPLYLYPIPPGGPSPTTADGVPECKFFKLGHCAKGDKCRFIHVPKTE